MASRTYLITVTALDTSTSLDGSTAKAGKNQKSERSSFILIRTKLPMVDKDGDGDAGCSFTADLKGEKRDRDDWTKATWVQSGTDGVFYLKSIGINARLFGFVGKPLDGGEGIVTGDREFWIKWRCELYKKSS